MSEQDRLRWNQRYRDRATRVSEPALFLRSLDDVLPTQGRALDVAGGAGRNAVWLAQRGLEVSLLDISDVALERARAAARESQIELIEIRRDLDHDPFPPGPWHVIVDFHFLARELFSEFARALAPGGYLVFVQPTMANLTRHSKPGAKYLLRDGELPGLIERAGPPQLEIVQYREGWSEEGRHEAELLARRT